MNVLDVPIRNEEDFAFFDLSVGIVETRGMKQSIRLLFEVNSSAYTYSESMS